MVASKAPGSRLRSGCTGMHTGILRSNMGDSRTRLSPEAIDAFWEQEDSYWAIDKVQEIVFKGSMSSIAALESLAAQAPDEAALRELANDNLKDLVKLTLDL